MKSEPKIVVNIDALPIDMSIRVKTFKVSGIDISARPLNAEDFWILKVIYPQWDTHNAFDLLDMYYDKAFVLLAWLGTRRDTLGMQDMSLMNSILCTETIPEWEPILMYILDVGFVRGKSGDCPPKQDDWQRQLKNMKDTGAV